MAESKPKFLSFGESFTIFLGIKNVEQRKAYLEFCESRISAMSMNFVILLYLAAALVEIYFFPKVQWSILEMLCASLFLALVMVGSTIIYIWTDNSSFRFRSDIESIFIIGVCCFNSLLLFDKITKDPAIHIVFNQDVVLCLFSPLLLSLVFHSDWWISFLCWCISLAPLVLVCIFSQSSQTIVATLCFLLLSQAINYEIRRQSLSKFLLAQNLKLLLAENERMADELHANELRHMIGNVAHDLKTPLSGFTNGSETIRDIIADCEHPDRSEDVTFLRASLLSIKGCVHNMGSINNFMIMTINRCIDYTKASKGLKLIPRFETISLTDALNLPIGCLNDIQNRISVSLADVPPEICSHVITDKQWLQENVLCLLSNAVKYSKSGAVTIRTSLVPPPESANKHLNSSNDTHNNNNTKSLSTSSESAASTVSSPSESSPFLRVEVEDTGIGLSDEVMGGLFKPFKQAQRLAGGTGLGLYSLAMRIEALHGTYGVDKRRDGKQGSVFWFTIPYRPDASSAEDARADLELSENQEGETGGTGRGHQESDVLNWRGSATSSQSVDSADYPLMHKSDIIRSASTDVSELQTLNGHPDKCSVFVSTSASGSSSRIATPTNAAHPPLNILLVDDSLSILKMSSMLLRRQGHTVTTAENGAEAVDKVAQHLATHGRPYDVVLMDLQMPVMDGLEATKRLRETFKKPDTTTEFCSTAGGSSAAGDTSGGASWGTDHLQHSDYQLVIGVSANSDSVTMALALDLGMDAFLSKPFSIESFHATYRRLHQGRNK